MIRPPDEETRRQLSQLGYHGTPSSSPRNRPLLICDVDEVVLKLVEPFAAILEEDGFSLKSRSFKLTGNVFAPDGSEATQEQVWSALVRLFEQQTQRQPVVAGAVEALISLARDIDIVFFTNLPHQFGDIRRNYLGDQGLNFPLVTNTGSKTGGIALLRTHHAAPVGFIDDTPRNLNQVRDAFDDIELFHFMADDAFRALVDVDGVHFSTGDWVTAEAGIRHVLLGTGD